MSFNGFGENLDDMSFERLLELMEPRLLFYCVSWQHGLKDYDYDDIYQLLSIKLWKIWKNKKLPHNVFDYRTTRYLDQCFRMEIFQERRSKVPRGQYLKKNYDPKDTYYHSGHL